MELIERLLKGDKRGAARLITKVENNEVDAKTLLSKLYKYTGNAWVVGITGPPGGGKSTLTDKIVKALRKKEKKVGIIAVDPTSPFTGGAILGDRVRMKDLSSDPGVFIRSMSTRGDLGGLSRATRDAVKILDAYGLDYIFIETVGVGQSEIDIVKVADTVVMVVIPGMGDDIQAIKAGIMEIGDVFVVNKSDREGADRTKIEIEMMLHGDQRDWDPPVIKVEAINNNNIDQLINSLDKHEKHLKENERLLKKRARNSQVEILDLVQQHFMDTLLCNDTAKQEIYSYADKVARREIDPYTISSKIIKRMLK